MSWNKNLTQLNDALSILLPFKEDVLPFLAQAGINVSQIRFDSKSANLWFSILDTADRNGKLEALVNALIAAFPENPYLISYKSNALYDLGVDIKTAPWHRTLPDAQFEKILGNTSTLLPIHFLTEGIEAAKCVVRIVLPTAKGTRLGTGFLIDSNLIVTNNHVISNEHDASNAAIEFDYEEIKPGHLKEVRAFKLSPQSIFLTSEADDWTIVKIDGDANKEFGSLKLQAESLQIGSFVNIIQHPGGRYKQIGLYRNIVTYADDRTIQYLTDTEPGSSGSPVFNSKWEVVALHNSSGTAKETVSSNVYLRNQGINIEKIIVALKEIQPDKF
ncbi:trypsin-like peptidase domain-containing protein [Larkinella sp.]|uniref:trypsin-like peptidase domain-containing protein n=1 Tax=Larkinella sp. TaxID=2034517 RepID=UPI003BAB7A34